MSVRNPSADVHMKPSKKKGYFPPATSPHKTKGINQVLCTSVAKIENHLQLKTPPLSVGVLAGI